MKNDSLVPLVIPALLLAGRMESASAQSPALVPTAFVVNSVESGEQLGVVATCVGDWDGDGYDDAVVTASHRDAGALVDAGWIGLFRGGPSGLTSVPAWTQTGSSSIAHFGDTTTAAVGDVTGDGIPDLLVGRQSALDLWAGNASGFTPTGWTTTAFLLSTARRTRGDFDGDGMDDILITHTDGSGISSTGRIELYRGAMGLPSTTPVWTLQGGNGFGRLIEHAGDVNGDGLDDILIATLPYAPVTTSGSASCWLGSSTTPVASSWSVTGTQSNDLFASALSGVGDVNGDGFDDVLIGAPGHNGGSSGAGQVSLYLGSSSGLSSTAAWTYTGQPGQQMGWSVAPAGDVDGDGFADFLVFWRGGTTGPQNVALFLGGPSGPGAVPDWTSLAPSGAYWWSFAGRPGDFDGDGLSDVLLGDSSGLGGAVRAWRGQAPITSFCAGIGGTACPCGNSGASGHGCDNSFATGGGLLSAAGAPRVSADTLVLAATALPPNASVLYFQGTTEVNGGAGALFGDGLRCAGGSVVRLATRTSVGGASSYPGAGDVPIGVRGMLPASGGVRTYQAWYRDVAVFCSSAPSNTTNGLEVVWFP